MKKIALLNFGKFAKKTSPIEVRIYIYGFKAESVKIENDFYNFLKKLNNQKIRVFLINSEDRVSDLNLGKKDMDYIRISCNNKKVLADLKKLLITDEVFRSHFIDFQQVALTSDASH